MFIAITGTPGTGKSSAASVLATKGHKIMSVEELAKEHGAGMEAEGTLLVDMDALSSKLLDISPESDLFIEGHLAHLLPNSLCIVLRCHPELIKSRLQARGYDEEKIRENMEAEAVDVILIEAMECCERVFEIDVTDMNPTNVAEVIESIINGGGEEFTPGKVDWSQAVMDWY